MTRDNSHDSALQVEALMVKVNAYAQLKAICSRQQSTFELQDLENRERTLKFDTKLVAAEVDLREALWSSFSDQAVAEAVRRRILARGREYIANLRAGGESTYSVEGFLMVLEVEAIDSTVEPPADS